MNGLLEIISSFDIGTDVFQTKTKKLAMRLQLKLVKGLIRINTSQQTAKVAYNHRLVL